MRKILAILSILYILIFLGGCAFDLIRLEQIPTNLSATTSCYNFFILSQDINVQLGGGYSRTLKKKTRWDCIGKIPQGDVYKTKDQILTVEASNVFEAYIVVSSNELVGFYLPVEATFSPLDTKIKLLHVNPVPINIQINRRMQ